MAAPQQRLHFLSVQHVDQWVRERKGDESTVRSMLARKEDLFPWPDRNSPKMLEEWLEIQAVKRDEAIKSREFELDERGAAASERAAVAAERSAAASDRAAFSSEVAAEAAKVSARWTFWAAIASAVAAVATAVATVVQVLGSR